MLERLVAGQRAGEQVFTAPHVARGALSLVLILDGLETVGLTAAAARIMLA